jgi:hypothetical protein
LSDQRRGVLFDELFDDRDELFDELDELDELEL